MADRRAVPASSEEYSKAIARVAVAQLAERERFSAMQVRWSRLYFGFTSSSCAELPLNPTLYHQDSAAEVLADILIQYITEVCHSSQSYARHAGRSEFNILDVLLSLDDIGQPLDELDHVNDKVVPPFPVEHINAPLQPWSCRACGADHVNQDPEVCRLCCRLHGHDALGTYYLAPGCEFLKSCRPRPGQAPRRDSHLG